MNLLTHQFIPYLFRKRHYFAVIFLSLSFVGCSALQADLTGDRGVTKVNYESTNWDAFNQDAYLFNKSLDDHVLKPIAIGYKKVTPAFLDTGISNVFSNLREVPNTINALLQFKLKDAATDTGRFVINSTLGIAGFFDVASKLDLPKHNEDFGQTLAVWGVPSGPYVMLPFFGPSTARDSIGLLVDSVTNPSFFFEDSLAYYAVDRIDKRADLLATEDALKGMSDDQYQVLRSAWLQQRRYLIKDGKLDAKAIDEKKSLIDELEDLD